MPGQLMAAIHIRNVPDDLYQQLQREAATDKLSLSAQVVVLLQKAVQGLYQQRAQAELLQQMRCSRATLLPDSPDSINLFRDDRSR